MSHAGPAAPWPDVAAGSLPAWYDDHRIGDSPLYDITAQAATSLAALLVQRQLAAGDGRERGHWAARVCLVSRQRAALDPGDRAGLIAQQQAWLDEADALTREPPAESA
jgi:hypothetical protein